MTAIRLARGATGRSTLVKFAGNYHGHCDALLAAGGQRRGRCAGTVASPAPPASPPARSPTPSSRRTTWCPRSTTTVAVVIVEPVAANMGLVPPLPGFLEGLRAECDRVGALLIFDEVITGFRLGRRRRHRVVRRHARTSGASAR